MKLTDSFQTRTLVLSLAIGCCALVATGGYAMSNTSGHSSLNPYLGLFIFGPITAVGLTGLVLADVRSTRHYSTAVVIVGAAGIVLLVYFDISNSLLQYEEWTRRGMP